jgi:sulfite oxidase
MNALPWNHSLIIRSENPLNAETPLPLLRENFITPEKHFFIRNHGGIPEISPERYRLRVTDRVHRPLDLSLKQIRTEFKSKTITAVLQCAGNRRSELAHIAPIRGEINWNAGAIGNARWTGVLLRDILAEAGIDSEAAYVFFAGMDAIEPSGPSSAFGASIPISKAMSEEVILAYGMNEKPLSKIHGFPLRAIVPGYIGARSVKWLGEIAVQALPSNNYFQSHAYKIFPSDVRDETADWSTGISLGSYPVNAVITSPREGAQLKTGPFMVHGYAIAGGRSIERVDLSLNKGETWITAELLGASDPWSWRFWKKEIKLEAGIVHLSVRAWDSAMQTQPEDPVKIWNFKGYVNSAWHCIPFSVHS